MAETKSEQIAVSERLQVKLLNRWEALLDSGELSPTDAATLARFLRENGWSVDPAKVPSGIKGILTKTIDPKSLEDDIYDGGLN